MKLKGWDFATACREIDNIVGTDWTSQKSAKKLHYTADPAWRLKQIERVIAEANRPDIVSSYLSRRGLSVTSPVLRGHPCLRYFDDDNRQIGQFPALVAPIVGLDGDLRSALRIYDANIEPRKKTMAKVSDINGAAVQLFGSTDELGIAEGVETALACFQLFGIPVWSVISANGISSFIPPPGLRRLIIFADHDHNFVGQTAAYRLAERLARDGLTVKVKIPPEVDTDWLDVLLHG
jgi:putative DNA primase/helicase